MNEEAAAARIEDYGEIFFGFVFSMEKSGFSILVSLRTDIVISREEKTYR